jgi:hypothetical protein
VCPPVCASIVEGLLPGGRNAAVVCGSSGDGTVRSRLVTPLAAADVLRRGKTWTPLLLDPYRVVTGSSTVGAELLGPARTSAVHGFRTPPGAARGSSAEAA